MRMLFGVLGLLVALAVVGLLAVKQLRATGQAVGAALPAAVPAEPGASVATVREQSRQIQQKIQSDVTRMLEQGAASRRDEAGQ